MHFEVTFSQQRLLEELAPVLTILDSFESCKTSDFHKLEEREFRVLIKHNFINGESPKPIQEKIGKYLSQSAPLIGEICVQFKQFSSNQINTSDADRSGQPAETFTPEIIMKMYYLVKVERRLETSRISSAEGNSIK